MEGRLSEEREKHFRWIADIAIDGAEAGEVARELLAEITALRAELAGAEERGERDDHVRTEASDE